MVSVVNSEQFWFRIRLFLQAKNRSLPWLAGVLGRRNHYIANRSSKNKVTKKEAKEILDALGLTAQDISSPIEAFANKHLRNNDDDFASSKRAVRNGWEEGSSCLDEV